MRANWNIILSTGPSNLVDVTGLPWPVELKPNARSRSVRLRVDEGRGRLVLTFPRHMSRRRALDWAGQQGEWAACQVDKMEPPIAFEPGAVIPVEGIGRRIVWEERLARTPQLGRSELRCGGPRAAMAGRIERFLRQLARTRLSERTAYHAARADVTVRSVSVADTRSRWGSCSASGSIRYNWRLVLAPPEILDWVVAHEVAHRRHMNHGPEFRQLEARLYEGDISAARTALRRLGPGLKRVGRTI